MATPKSHLTNAPITEAVIDFRVRPKADFKVASLDAIAKELEPTYAVKGPIFELAARFGIDPKGESQSDLQSKEVGLRLHSVDDRYVLQVQQGGLSLSRMSPYESWDSLLQEARRLWQLYIGVARPDQVVRAATRFINNLRLPMQPGEDFNVYLTKPPQVPDGLPQGLVSFLHRVLMYDPKLDIHAMLTQALEPFSAGAAPDRVPVILDIDVYRIAEFAADGPEIWACLSQLRDFKNRAFFSSMTDKAIELYQ
jgi:uncharacterized protein (TIGR04255 family)